MFNSSLSVVVFKDSVPLTTSLSQCPGVTRANNVDQRERIAATPVGGRSDGTIESCPIERVLADDDHRSPRRNDIVQTRRGINNVPGCGLPDNGIEGLPRGSELLEGGKRVGARF